MNKQEFQEKLKEYQIVLTEKMCDQFQQYFSLLKHYNDVMDLTNVIDEDAVYERHFFNSLTIAFHRDFNHLSLCDIGSGAGFPAIPLKIVFPQMRLTIIDSLAKRTNFLKMVSETLQLDDVNIISERAEIMANPLQEQFDIVTARAVAKLNILAELCCQYVKVNGLFIAMKGEKADEELHEATHALQCLHLKLIDKTHYPPSWNLYFIKEKKVSTKYPRAFGEIKKKPL